ncbi:MAG TPA: DUF3253 domain-containing protein [Ilumatobacteraceae bacterium]|nr:DUF3253 domain-containing protein [Ilumatobacteraceae bacterium]
MIARAAAAVGAITAAIQADAAADRKVGAAAGYGSAVTDEQRYVVIDGRRWRRRDPNIPDGLAAELVAELMAARRAVGAAGDDATALRAARDRVQAAKVALGERGPAWWDEPSADAVADRAAAAVRALLAHRGPERSICPSDVARVVGGASWRRRMDDVREVARRLVRDGAVVVTQRGATLDADAEWRGPIRIRTAG